jgi:hypothetical protein
VGPGAGQLTWYKRRERCESGACVEISVQGESVAIRSSIDPGIILTLTRTEWQDFLAGAKEGSFDSL